ncbi:acetate--CoA ligase family protein [Bosea sp. (in: a-proteobacteria)]|uniref:acetate--CoA ligase family protein n=1 Tax=Bosea sp. (in: a-proteobacteria) TaxID=1871050 RepID=UPI00260790DF|nr:acetate--CoA ligase family protein [Bosea sp. (in: a-proteobacteria)]MCO5089482.1 acetate--CoA ligase family protein [Bosea sp. (in: a-proteobacteria)]
MHRSPLSRLLAPRSVALVGASERPHSAGLRVLGNIIAGRFGGAIYPVNPRYETILGLPCHPSLSSLPEVPDTVFVAIPGEQISGIVDEAGRLGVGAIMTNASGFSDAGPEGEKRQEELVGRIRRHGMVLCGPNNSGFINLWDRFCPSTFYDLPVTGPGPVCVVSQSGSVSAALSQDDRGLGIGYNITVGTEAALDVCDYAEFVLAEERVRVVMCFIETLRNPQRFAAIARNAACRGKRIIVTKVGRSEGGRSAAAAHSGALVGDDAVYDAFFERNGIVRAPDLDAMIEAAKLFSHHAPPLRPGTVVVTMSGGEAGLIADVAAEVSLPLMSLSAERITALKPDVSPYLVPRNPLDSMGLSWDKERFARIIRTLRADPEIGAIAIASDASGAGVGDQLMVNDMAHVCAAENMGDTRVVFFTNTAGGGPNRDIDAVLGRAGIPFLCGMRASLAAMGGWSKACVAFEDSAPAPARADAARFLDADEAERFAALSAAGVPMAMSLKVTDAGAAVAAAARIGRPVALKATAPDLLHKSELGLLRLNLSTPAAVAGAFEDLSAGLARHSAGPGAAVIMQPMAPAGLELIIAVRKEPGFGNIVVVGLGGVFVELLRESAIRIGPVTTAQAKAMLASSRAGQLMDGFRGEGPYDIDAAAGAIAALSDFAEGLGPQVSAVEINPLIVHRRGDGATGVDVAVERSAHSAGH